MGAISGNPPVSLNSLISSCDTSHYIENEIISSLEEIHLACSHQNLALKRVEVAARSLSDTQLSFFPRPVMDMLFRLQRLYPSNSPEEALQLANFATDLSNETFDCSTDSPKFEIITTVLNDKMLGFVERILDNGIIHPEVYVLQLKGAGKHKKHFQATHLQTFKQRAFQFIEIQNPSCKPPNNEALKQKRMINNELLMQEELKDIKGCVVAKKVFETDSYIIMNTSFCNRGTLQREIKVCGEIYEKRIIQELYLLSGIFARMHEKKIIHGDIKPDNIMFKYSRKRNRQELRVIDFGTSQILDKKDKTRALRGPMLLLPPEATKVRLKILELNEIIETLKKNKENMASKNTLKSLRKRISKKRNELKNAQERISNKLDVYMLGSTMYMRNNKGELPPLQKEFAESIEQGKASTLEELQDIYLNMTAHTAPYKEPSRRNFLGHLIWSMQQPDQHRRPSMAKIQSILIKRQPSLKKETLS